MYGYIGEYRISPEGMRRGRVAREERVGGRVERREGSKRERGRGERGER